MKNELFTVEMNRLFKVTVSEVAYTMHHLVFASNKNNAIYEVLAQQRVTDSINTVAVEESSYVVSETDEEVVELIGCKSQGEVFVYRKYNDDDSTLIVLEDNSSEELTIMDKALVTWTNSIEE